MDKPHTFTIMEGVSPVMAPLSPEEVRTVEEFRKRRNTAVLAVMFTDIVGSTNATERLGEKVYTRLRHLHDELVRQIITRDGAGTIVKEIGDSFLCVFAEPSAAVERAVEVQRAILRNRENLSAGEYTLTVRIGIHMGQVAVEDTLRQDVFGRQVNMAARIESLASGGQVLTSRSVWENAVGWAANDPTSDIGHIRYGKAKLKGFDEPVELFGFHSKKAAVPPVPAPIKSQKRRSLFAAVSIGILVGAMGYGLFKLYNGRVAPKEVAFTDGKPYYIQFDFSGLQPDSTAAWVDTMAIKRTFVSQAISVFAPMAVWGEGELMEHCLSVGIPYLRHRNERSLDSLFFRDTLGLAGTFFITAKPYGPVDDTLRMNVKSDLYPGSTTSQRASLECYLTAKGLEKEARNTLQYIMDASKRKSLGTVIMVDDNTFTFRLAPGAVVSKGSRVFLRRYYVGYEGLKVRLADTHMYLQHYRNVLRDPAQWDGLVEPEELPDGMTLQDALMAVLGSLEGDSVEIQKLLNDDPNFSGTYYPSVAVGGFVTAIADSVAQTTWDADEPDRPRVGDEVQLE